MREQKGVELKTLSVAAEEGRSATAPPFQPQPTAFSSVTTYLAGKQSAAGSAPEFNIYNALRYDMTIKSNRKIGLPLTNLIFRIIIVSINVSAFLNIDIWPWFLRVKELWQTS